MKQRGSRSPLTIYMVTHKPVDVIPKGRSPIFVGKGDNSQGYQTDSEGENIADKNPYYCELTAYYWIWKNDTVSEYVGIEHYRRFFMARWSPFIASNSEILKSLRKGRVIATKQYYFEQSISDYYGEHHFANDIDVMREAVEHISPEYLDGFDQFFAGNASVMLNMVALPKKMFDAYAEWLFAVLEYVEEHIDISDRDAYQQRVYGFLAERLLNVWLQTTVGDVDHRDVFILEDTFAKSHIKNLKSWIRWRKNEFGKS